MPRRSTTSFVACLEGCVKMLNYFVALMGLSMMALAAYFMVQLTGALHEGPLAQHQVYAGRAQVIKASWFIICFGCAGLYVFLTALTALVGAGSKNVLCLNLNVALMLVGLAGQLLLALVFFLDASWERRLPPDPAYDQVKAFIRKQIVVCKWFALGAVAVQLLSLLLTLVLQSAYVHHLEVQEDEEAVWRRRPLLQRPPTQRAGPPVLPQGGAQRTDVWSARMREQYGLDTSRYTYAPSAPPSMATGHPVPTTTTVVARPEPSCVVM